MKVHKYPLKGELNQVQGIELPKYAKILTIGIDEYKEMGEYKEMPALWAAFEEGQTQTYTARILITGTGFIVPDPTPGFDWVYINTYQRGFVMWHAFVQDKY